MSVWVIIPAAGIGARMEADRPKQYMLIHGKPMISYSVDVFLRLSIIEKVVVAINAEDRWWTSLSCSQHEKTMTVVGGHERVDSVLSALTFLEESAAPDDWVLVHDAARPCISEVAVQHLVAQLKDHPVGGLFGLPVVDTLKRLNDAGEVEATISRVGLWRAQTPQMFRFGILKQAIEKALYDGVLITDEASAIEYIGLQPKMLLGQSENIKVTLPEDLSLAALFIR